MKRITALRHQLALDPIFIFITYSLALFSLQSVTLLSIGYFTRAISIAGAACCAAISLYLTLRSQDKRSLAPQYARPHWLILAILLVAILLRSNPASYLSGGQDPGVYSSMALHFANTGALELHDSLLDDLSDNTEIRSDYLKRSMHRLTEISPNKWSGNMLPGVYLSDLAKNQWNFQFYALHPAWLAIGNWLFGVQHQSWILVFFSTLTVLCAYLITSRITGNHIAAACAALLLAINPGHAYMATFPVSETIAGFFFLSSIYLLITKRYFSLILPLTALFLTRITGFITTPFLLISLGWVLLRQRDYRALWAGYGVITAYAISFYWGLRFAPNYSFDIYKSKLGIDRQILSQAWVLFLALGITWSAVGLLLKVKRHRSSKLIWQVSRYRFYISSAIVGAIISACIYKGYLLAFTDHYQNSSWLAKRWHMAGQGWGSVRYLSANTLRLMLSSMGLLTFIGGLIYTGALACRRSSVAPIPILGAAFSSAFLIGQLTTPVTYFYSRYLVSEVVPLATICAALLIQRLRGHLKYGGTLIVPIYGAFVLYSVWGPLFGRLSATESAGLSQAVECIHASTHSRSVIIIDRQNLALGAYAYSTPLRLGFNRRTYTLSFSDMITDPIKFEALISYFKTKGLDIFLLSSQKQWENYPHFTHTLPISITEEHLFARGRLPTTFTKRQRLVRLYSQHAFDHVPQVCKPNLGG